MRTRVVVQGRRRSRGERLARALWGAAETAVTLGVVALLLVVHQLWWTNRQARAEAERRVDALEQQWDDGGGGGTGRGATADADADGDTEAGTEARPSGEEPAAGGGGRSAGSGRGGGAGQARMDRAYAVVRIPAIGVTAPVAEGVGKAAVLNKGYVGHYPRTARPGAPGNFALAGHRNTHGEPFRRINRLRPGDTVEIETRSERFVYAVERTVARTAPGDGTVLGPVPHSSVHPEQRMRGRGYYLTLTTCTPEYTSTYRLVVWGRLRSAAPR